MESTKKKWAEILSDNIVSRRVALGFRSAEKFAETADIPYPTLRDIEAGISGGRPATLQKIAKALKCTIDDLTRENNVEASAHTSPLISEAISILTTFNEEQLERALVALEALRNASRRQALPKKLKGSG